MTRTTREFLTALLVVLMLASALVAAIPAAASPDVAPAPVPSRGSSSPDGPLTPEMDAFLREYLDRRSASPPYVGKMSPTVREWAGTGEGTVRAVVATDDVVELGAYLRSVGIDTPVGSVPTGVQGLRAVVVEVPAPLLGKIAALEHVLEIAPAVQPELAALADPDVPGLVGEGPAPTLIEAGKGHHVPDAWALGYTGTGIRVAPMDSGTDFGHPDLHGTYARVTDPASPYFNPIFGLGWPMAFDPYSMEVYLFTGGVGQFPLAGFSWYVNTSFETTANPITGLIDTPFLGRTYNVSGIVSASGAYHIGLHPDRTLRFSTTFDYYQFVGLLVTDPIVPGVYDTVYVDLDHDKYFGDDKPVNLLSPEIYADYYDASTSVWDNASWAAGDGIADMSGGMAYFIADGANPIPYTPNIAAWYGLPLPPVPGAGDLVALQIGDIRTLGGGDHGTFVASSIVAQNVTGAVHGFAPDARLISVGNVYASALLFYDMWRFVGEGYDGVPGTGDEAHIASASFGFSGTFNDGFDFASRWADLWSLVYSDTAYVVSSGNGGHGFGTVTAPGTGWNVITVGASTSYNAATPFPVGASDAGAHSTFGDVQPWSNRGPSTLGQVKPDVVTVGAWASGDGALNSFGGRTSPWAVWGGTSLSAPATAGILALVKEAFYDTFGPPMEGFLAKAFLMAGADNIHYDPLVMGAGLTNALQSVRRAAAIDGIVPIDLTGFPASQWPAGDFRGTVYPAFPRLMYPGTNNTTTFSLGNVQSSGDKDVTISDWWLQKVGNDTFTFTTADAAESPPNFLRPDYLVDITGLVPAGTALVKATVTFPFSQFDPDGNYQFNSRWRVLLYNWKDYNANGSFWTDANGNGVVNAGEMDATMGTEIQRFAYGYPSHTNIQAFVHDPISRIDDGLLLGIQHRTVSPLVPATTLTITLDYYAAVDAPWLSASPSSMSIPCCAPFVFAPITLTADIPMGTPPGVLSGVVTVHNVTTGDINIPVIVNVAAVGPTLAFGGDPTGVRFYDNSRTFGGNDWSWRAESGDWRFYFTDIPDSTPIAPGERLLVHTWWENVPTDLDTFVLGPSPDDCFIYPPPCFTPSGLFGPYSLNVIGQSDQRYLGSGRWVFDTATGGPEEWVSAPLTTTGLHGVALHNVVYAGMGPSEVLNGEVGTFAATPNPWFTVTPNGTGTGLFNVSSSLGLPGLDVLAFGLSPFTFAFGLSINETADYTETFTVSDAGFIDVQIDGSANPPGTDLDLYLERWTGSAWAAVASGTTPAAFELVHVVLPVDGLYRVRVDGFAIPGGSGSFNMFRLIPEGSELTPQDVPATPIPAGSPSNFNVSWDIDVGTLPGLYFGVVFVGPENAATTVEIIAPFFLFDAQAPEILATSPANGESINDQSPTIQVDYVDPVVSAGVAFVLFTLDGFPFLSAFGTFNETTFTWSTPFDLSLGTHVANLTIFDGAGFVTWYEWSFTIDTAPPALFVTSPDFDLTNSPSVTVAGTTEPGASITVGGLAVAVSGAGAFGTTAILAEGANTIVIVATDAAGNSASETRSVTLDTVAPAVAITSPASGAILASRVVTASGTAEAGAELTVNGVRVAVASAGTWSADLAFADGPHTITVRAVDAAGNVATVTRSITIDTTAPSLSVTSPDFELTNTPSVTVSGTTEPGVSLTLNGAAVAVGAGGAFSTTLTLVAGSNTITIVATDAAGNSATVTKPVTFDSAAPAISVISPAPGAILTSSIVTVSGTTESGAEVTVNGVRVDVSGAGAWAVDLVLADGAQSIVVRVVDAAGNSATVTRSVTVDTMAPALSVTSPDYDLTTVAAVTVSGTTEPGATITVDGAPVTVAGSGAFTTSVTLSEGANTITVVATDAAGNSVTVTRRVTRDTVAPAITVSAPADGAVTSSTAVTVSGTVEVGAGVTVNGIRAAVSATGAWSVSLALSDGTQTITVTAVDAAGNSVTDARDVTVDTRAPSVSATASGTAGEADWYTSDVTLALSASDPSPSSSVAAIEWRFNGSGTWYSRSGATATVSLTTDGTHVVEVRAVDAAGNVGPERAVTVRVDTAAPTVTVATPLDGVEVEAPFVEFTGLVGDPNATVIVGGVQVRPDASGSWRAVVALKEGPNAITVTAVDAAGNAAATQTRTVTYRSPLPDIQQDISENTNTISSVGSNLSFGLIALIVVLVVLQLILYRNLNKKIEDARRGEMPPPPPEGPPEEEGRP